MSLNPRTHPYQWVKIKKTRIRLFISFILFVMTMTSTFLDASSELVSETTTTASGELLETTAVLVNTAATVIDSGLSALTAEVQLLPQVPGIESVSPASAWIHEVFPVVAGFSDIQLLGIGFLLLIWILSISWTLRDAMARSENLGFQLFSAVLVALLTPVVGLPIYLTIRPLTYLWERGYWREAIAVQTVFCPHCENIVDAQHKACVYCGEPLQTTCRECEQKYYRGYHYCPECSAPNLD